MTTHRKRRLIAGLAVATALAFTAAACGSSGSSSSGSSGAKAPTKLGAGEGALNIIAWAGYAEDGSNDPKVDWVSDFEKSSGCKVNVKTGNTSDEMVQLMKTGEYDGVSASGDATLRLIAGGDVAPVNTDLVPNYADISSFLKDTHYNSADGVNYGIPHGWGANLLMWNKSNVTPAPDSWGAVFEKDSPYKGKLTAYDSPIYIADAALYLMKTKPELGIKDPYALKQNQFDAAISLLKQQKPNVGEYWSDYLKAVDAFEKGSLQLGTTWQVIANTIEADKPGTVETVLPKEGSTAWSDTWMVSSKAKHPNCMYKWMDHITSPKVQAQVAEYFGEAPANPKACTETTDPNFCKTYHADDAAFAKQLYYWTTPTKKCLDGSGDDCVDYQKWTAAWNDLRGS
ncbi:ABC transporter substrate-binding protein [Aquihabitans sp. McL0605]|uniref:ABC transporter substrate-binding protein n=1 Tax=Aquihabitans sp. McL0605 TaxID=3415671 RepID=UPI003CE76545